jgi:cell fate regulator YaaT (PSP1 superfamily)
MNHTDILYTRGCCVSHSKEGETKWQQSTGCQQLSTSSWACSGCNAALPSNIVEVRFKHTHKDFFKTDGTMLRVGDAVAVEAQSKYDIGLVSLTGDLAYKQMLHYGLDPDTYPFKNVFRKARAVEIDRWCEAAAQEQPLMIRTRQIVAALHLDMKIGDVELFADQSRAIFYYIADERVDFRELIKILADEFKIRVEMKQIGARQEAGRIGSIGVCGRPSCCSSFLTKYPSVTTVSARDMEYSNNSNKLSGQCSKLKCCLDFEHAAYMDAKKDFPILPDIAKLYTVTGTAFHLKTDVFKRRMWYHYMDNPDVPIPVPVDRVKEIIEINKRGEKVDALTEEQKKMCNKRQQHSTSSKTRTEDDDPTGYMNDAEVSSVSRFDTKLQEQAETRKHKPERKHDSRDKNHDIHANNYDTRDNKRTRRRPKPKSAHIPKEK